MQWNVLIQRSSRNCLSHLNMLTRRTSNDGSTEYRTASRISIVTHLAWYHIKLVIVFKSRSLIILRSSWYIDLPLKYHDKFPVALCYLGKLRTWSLENRPSSLSESQYLLFKALDFLSLTSTRYTRIIVSKSIMGGTVSPSIEVSLKLSLFDEHSDS